MAFIPKKLLFTTIGLILLLNQNFANSTDWTWPAWLDDDLRSNSSLICDPTRQGELSTIDRKLGCDCIFEKVTEYIADCSKQSLGLDIAPTPAKLNVSLSIRKLIFAENDFTKLDEDTFGDVDGVHELDFSKNRIQSISNLNFTRLIKIDLSFNQITNLTEDTFKNCLKLQEIDLSFNNIKFIEEKALNQLQFLNKVNLASNQIGIGVEFYDEYEFKLINMEWLQEVDLSNNSLNDFPTSIFEGSVNIKILRLRNNMIRAIPQEAFSYLPMLEELDLSGNYLTTLVPNGFHGFKKLQTLVLNGLTDLTKIEKYAFSGLRSLKDFSCERNHRLTIIDALAFRADPEMEDCEASNPKLVKLSDDSLSYIDFGLLNWTSLEELILLRNPWYCDCKLQWVPQFNKHNPKDATELRDFSCHGPKPLKGVNVVDADPDEMLCFSPSVTIAASFGVLVICLILIAMCSLFVMKTFGTLPNCLKRFDIFGNPNSLPKYTPLPKPGPQRVETGELEWDSTDLPPVYNIK